MAGYQNARGERTELNLSVQLYAEAGAQGMSLPQYINANARDIHIERDGSAWQQVLAGEGIFLQPNREHGISPTRLSQMFGNAPAANTNIRDAVPTSRILMPAVVMQAVEDRLFDATQQTTFAFEQLLTVDESISGARYEWPVLNFDRPSQARHQGSSQLALPNVMLTITASERSARIPSFTMGMEIADQALEWTSIDFVALSIARQAIIERNERARGYMTAMLNGDVDNGETSLASLGRVDLAAVFDPLAIGGVLTQKAWMKWLMKDSGKRRVSHIVTDIDTGLRVENRTGKPVITQDDGTTSRFDTQFNVLNPTWSRNPGMIITDDPAWPANTLVGVDDTWALRRVRNLLADYSAVEEYVMRRAKAMRFDFGEHVTRIDPLAEGFAVLSLI